MTSSNAVDKLPARGNDVGLVSCAVGSRPPWWSRATRGPEDRAGESGDVGRGFGPADEKSAASDTGIEDFKRVYLESFAVLTAELEATIGAHPVFGSIFRSLDPEARKARAEESRERIFAALGGDWAPYEASLQRDGAMYARLGIGFETWYELTGTWLHVLTPILVQHLAAEPARLCGALRAMQAFAGRAAAIMGASYVTASKAELARWEALFQRVSWGIAITDEVGNIAAANPAFVKMYGMRLEDILGRTMAPLFAPGEYERVVATHRPRAHELGYSTYEATHQRGDGSAFPIRIEAARISDTGERPTWVITVHDLSDRVQVQSLRARGVELEVENRKIQEASRMKSEFLANMSHELRTPLNSILGFSSLLVDGAVGPLAAQQAEFIGDIHTSGKHLLRLINDVLDLSKVEAGRMEFQPEEIDLEALTAEVANVLRGVEVEKRLRVVVTSAPTLRSVHLDPARLKQVLYNFLSNACKFSPPGATVELRLLDAGESFRIEVADEGPGIVEKDLKRLFIEFEQLDASSTKLHAGTGLGLALTRGLVEAQGGSVGVTSTPGEGSVFWAVLPKRSESLTTLPTPRHLPGVSLASPRVLVVDDDVHDQDRIVSSLLRAGCAVDVVATGAQASRALEARAYDAITLDLILPDTSGLDLVRRIRSSATHDRTPVIIVSLVTEAALGGFVVSDVLPKPVSSEAIVEALARAGVRAPGRGPVLVVDDDQPSARLMAASLERAGFSALIAHDGELALAASRRVLPSAVVLDLVMPNLDGVAFLQRVRSDPAWRDVPIFIWSVKELTRADHEALLQHASAIFPKDGASVGALVDLLERHLQRSSGSARAGEEAG